MKQVIRHVDEGCAFATHGPLVITIWRREPTRARIDLAAALMVEHAAAIGSQIGTLAVIEEGAPPPAAEDMPSVLAAHERVAPLIAAAAAVFETTSVDVPELRRAAEEVGGHLALHVPLNLCFSVAEACTWLVRRTQPDAEPDYRHGLERAIEMIRAAIPSDRGADSPKR